MPQFKKFSTMPFCQDGILPRWHFRLFFLCLRLNSSNFLKQHFSKMALSFFLSLSTPRFKYFSKTTFSKMAFLCYFFIFVHASIQVVVKDDICMETLLFSMPKFKYSSFQRWNFCEKCFPSSTPRFW